MIIRFSNFFPSNIRTFAIFVLNFFFFSLPPSFLCSLIVDIGVVSIGRHTANLFFRFQYGCSFPDISICSGRFCFCFFRVCVCSPPTGQSCGLYYAELIFITVRVRVPPESNTLWNSELSLIGQDPPY